MRKILCSLCLILPISLIGKVYDCFTFFNEVEVLKIRLEELFDVVDHFVIVEGTKTFTGKDKPLYFSESIDDFEKYKSKIIHIVVDQFPAETSDANKNHWVREELSRNSILRGLQQCELDDIIFISDLDEIPNRNSVVEIKEYFSKLSEGQRKSRKRIRENKLVCSLDMRLFMFQLNRENPMGWLGGSKAVPYWLVKKYSPWGIKIFHHSHNNLHIVRNAGWHFNTIGDKEWCLNKWLSVGPLYDAEPYLQDLKKNEAELEKVYQHHVNSQTSPIPIDSTFPKHIVENLDYYSSIGWIAELED